MFLPLFVAALVQSGGDLLAKSASAEFGAKTLTASCTEQSVSALSTGTGSLTFTVSLSKPNKARIDMPDELIVADGVTITTYDKNGKSFMKKAQTDGELKALFASPELGIFAAFFDAGCYDKVHTGRVSKRSRRGASYDCVETDFELEGKQSAAFYLDSASKMMRIIELTPAEGAEKTTIVIFAKELEVDGKQADDLYTFSAPAGSHEITLEDLRRINNFVAPASCLDKAYETWHLCQHDQSGILTGGGEEYCGPTATSNGFTYLAAHGYPNLFQGDQTAALKLVALLGTPDYMGTNGIGTGPSQVLTGALRYIALKGYSVKSAGYEGWRRLNRATKSYVLAPEVNLDWVRRGIAMPNTVVLLNIGWYTDNGAGTITRNGGHWITAVGYGPNGGQDSDADNFVVHDPGKTIRNPPDDPKAWIPMDTIQLSPLGSGTLAGTETGLPKPAKGAYALSGRGLSVGSAKMAILDDAIVIELRPAK